MSYTIKVSHTKRERKLTNGAWVVVGEENGKPKYGYAPDRESTIESESDIYEQTVDDLDMSKLVAVVNGFAKP